MPIVGRFTREELMNEMGRHHFELRVQADAEDAAKGADAIDGAGGEGGEM
jgi:hypothetical protein